MQSKFVCALAIFAIVAAITFSEVDACGRCRDNSCGGCSGGYVAIAPPVHHYSSCHSCGGQYGGLSSLPKRYCGGCQRRKLYRLSGCGCGGACGCGGSCGGSCGCGGDW